MAAAYAQDDMPFLAYGESVENTLPEGGERSYRLSAGQGERLTLTLTPLDSDVRAYLILTDGERRDLLTMAAGNAGEGDKTRLTFVAPLSAVYVVTVTNTPGGMAGRFRLTLTLDNPPAAPLSAMETPIVAPLRPETHGMLNEGVGFALYAIRARRGDPLRVELSTDPALSASLTLYSGDLRTQLGTGNTDTPLTVALPAEGVYFLIVTRREGAGTFALRGDFPAEREGIPLSPDAAPSLVPGTTQGGVIDLDFAGIYRFIGAKETAIRIDVLHSDDLEVIALLTDSTFAQIGVGVGGIGRLILPADGEYILVVARRGGMAGAGSGAYSVILGSAPPEKPPIPLPIGETLSGTIHAEAVTVTYVISGRVGESLVIHMDAAAGSALDPALILLAPDGRRLAQNDDRASGLVQATIPYTFTKEGRYTVIATRSGGESGTTSGDYTLRVERRAVAATLTPHGELASETPSAAQTAVPAITSIAYGASAQGTLSSAEPLRYYVFRGAAGDVITIRMGRGGGGGLDPLLYLYAYAPDTAPTLIAANDNRPDAPDGAAGIEQITLPAQGDYLIVATRAGETVGDFILTLRREK
ncbi:MAG TPA: hypothetical protein PLD47_04420 [Aggregatilineales bacterium]|nr:hypothetical protein [Anaerolineales bacterium]HRE46947.1 hypothetical protein [Aggregatilineales bacterium]